MTELFKEEIQRLENVDFKTFAQNALKAAPASFKEDKELIDYTRKVFRVTEELLNADDVKGHVRDVILTGVLLCDLAKNEDPKLESVHPFMVRALLEDVKEDLVSQLFEGVMKIVEAHEGAKTPIPTLQPKPGSAEHLVALAHVIVRSDSITINL